MRFVSLDIRIGLQGAARMDPRVVSFHNEVASLLIDSSVERVGLPHSTPLRHWQIVHSAQRISAILEQAFEEAQARPERIDLCLLDFTNNLYVSVRDPILLGLAEAFERLGLAEACSRFVILLPLLPGNMAASTERFTGSRDAWSGAAPMLITLLASDGAQRSFDMAGGPIVEARNNEYASLVAARVKSVSARLDAKTIRRLGHFRTPSETQTRRCRSYSYGVAGATEEYLEALKSWWPENAVGVMAVLFDLAHDPCLRDALKTFADREGLPAERVVDVLSNPALGQTFAKLSPCLVVLDVVGKGQTLKDRASALRERGISLHSEMLAGVLKLRTPRVHLGGFQLHGLITVEPEEPGEPCEQCEIGLPLMGEAEDPIGPIRTYDMLHMADEAEWEPELFAEIPRDFASGYPALPRFNAMLTKHGAWLTHRLRRMLTEDLFPDSWVLVHPDEADSGQLAEMLSKQFDYRPELVRIPRSAIRRAEATDWPTVVSEHRTAEWCTRLQHVRSDAQCAILLDIFASSSRTLRSLAGLMGYFQLQVFAAVCLVNFRPDQNSGLLLTSELTANF